MKRGFLQMSFAWLFAIIAGAIIIVFAILAATKVINLGQSAAGAQSQAQLGALLNPLQTGFESSSVTSLATPSETRIYNTCSKAGTFGEQTISIAEKSAGKWPEFIPQGTSFENKYIFSENTTEGKQFLLFSKPFEFPFKSADLIYMTSALTDYCFINTPSDIEEELTNLNEQNIFMNSSFSNPCPKDSVTVCFDSSGCDISVSTSRKTVTKNGTAVSYYGDALMYGAIFSDPAVYECQLSRIMKRTSVLSQVYSDKSALVAKEGCNSGVGQEELNSFSNALDKFSNSGDLSGLVSKEDQINTENGYSTCQLW